MSEHEKHKGLNKKATIALLVASLASILAINYSLPLFSSGAGDGVDTGRITVGNITIHVDFKSTPDVTKANVTSTYADATVYDIMAVQFTVGHVMYSGYGLYVQYIDGQGPGWTYEVDGKAPGYTCTKYIVSNNSIITWIQV